MGIKLLTKSNRYGISIYQKMRMEIWICFITTESIILKTILYFSSKHRRRIFIIENILIGDVKS